MVERDMLNQKEGRESNETQVVDLVDPCCNSDMGRADVQLH